MAARTTAVIEKWSTGLVEPERRLDYWIGAVCECFLEVDITTPVRSGFDCSVQRGQLDTIGINRVEVSAQRQQLDGDAERSCIAPATQRSRAAGFAALL